MKISLFSIVARPFLTAVLAVAVLIPSPPALAQDAEEPFPVPQIPYAPREYVCYRTPDPIRIDGRLDEPAWQRAEWTDVFVDIEGDRKPPPRHTTRAKMLWDDGYFYVAAYLDEPHVWGTLTQRDAVIYHDNDFEVFIDPDGDTHEYYELEINALGTEWDLILIRPYRDGGPAVNAWDIAGLQTAVHVDGTINNPGDTDAGWSVEIAIPWSVLAECAHRPAPPGDGDQWWVNFSRVQWRTQAVDGAYVKTIDPATEAPLPEDNWVWSPQGLIAMHYPEMWGLVQFSGLPVGNRTTAFLPGEDKDARWALRRVYYAQREYHRQDGRYAPTLAALGLDNLPVAPYNWPPVIAATAHHFDATLTRRDGTRTLVISADGRLHTTDR